MFDYEIKIKKCGLVIHTVVTKAHDALMAINIAEKQYPVKSKQVLLGGRPVMWSGLEFETKRLS